MQDMPATNEREPIGRISVLEDTNNDGRMDKKTVFLDGLVLPRALKVLDRGVLVAEPPHLWLARDTNGDLKADSEGAGVRLLRHGAGERRAQRQRPALGARQLDAHVRRRHLPATEGRQVRDREGRSRADSGARRRTTSAASIATPTARRCTSTSCRRPTTRGIRTCCARAAATSSWAIRTSSTSTFPMRPNRGVNRGYVDGQLRADGTLATLHRRELRRRSIAATACRRSCAATCSSPSRPAISSAASSSATTARACGAGRRTTTPSSWRRPTSGSARCICRRRPTARSTSWTCTTASSSTRATSPSTCAITSSRESSKRRSTWAASSGSCTTRRGATRRPRSRPRRSAQLVETLAHPNGWWRDTAQRLLVERGDRRSSAR